MKRNRLLIATVCMLSYPSLVTAMEEVWVGYAGTSWLKRLDFSGQVLGQYSADTYGGAMTVVPEPTSLLLLIGGLPLLRRRPH